MYSAGGWCGWAIPASIVPRTVERVVTDLAALAGASPERVATTLAGNVEKFAAGHPAYDDVTLLVVRRG